MIDSQRIILGGVGDLSFPANSGSSADKSSISPVIIQLCSIFVAGRQAGPGCANICYVKNKKYEGGAAIAANNGAVCVTVFL